METRLTLPIGQLALEYQHSTLTTVRLNGIEVTDISSMIVISQSLKTQEDILQLQVLEFFSSKQGSMLKRLGNFWFDRENYSKALEAYERRRESSPRDVSNLTSIGGCLYLLEDINGAEDYLRRALAHQHDCFAALVNVSIVLNDTHRWREAAAFIEHALLKKPSNAYAKLEFAISCIYLNQFKTANSVISSLESYAKFTRLFQSRLVFAKALSTYYSGELGLSEQLLHKACQIYQRRLYEKQIFCLYLKIFARHEKFLVWRETSSHFLSQMGEHLFRRVVRYV
jgi:tetratricopeptide (TPR) repeat protein